MGVDIIRTDVIVVGAGVIGLAIGTALSEAGKHVLLVDQAGFGSKASGTNLGQLSISDREYGLEYELVMESLGIYSEVEKQRTLEYKSTGGIFPLKTQSDVERSIKLVKIKQDLGYNIELLFGDDIKRVEPYIEGLPGAVYCPDEGKINPFLVNSWLMDEGVKNGMEVLLYHAVKDIIIDGDLIKGLICGERTVEADTVVFATGAWSKALMRMIGIDLEVDYIRGSALVTQSFPQIMRGPVADGCYFTGDIPKDQAIFFGGIQEEKGSIIISQANRTVEHYDTSIDLSDLSDMAELFIKHFPILNDAQVVRTWSGVTSTTPDGNPYWGYTKKYNNLFLAVAFKGAFSLAPAVGKYTSQWIVDGKIEKAKKIWSPSLRGI